MSSPTWWNCNPSSAATPQSARPRASRVITPRNSCSARPPRCQGPMTTISTSNVVVTTTDPDPNCPLCPRLAEFRAQSRAQEPDWFNAPVLPFGDPGGKLLIVGLAPGLKGANRTGRPFTGDFAGDLL